MPNNNETKYVDQLKEDAPIPGQLWACLSFLSPEGIRNCSVRGLKIRGVFATREEAEAHAKKLSESDIFHVFVGEVGKWLPWDPDPNDAEDQVYQEEELQKLMHAYKQNQEKAKKMQQQRKSDMIQTTTQDEQKKSQTHQRLRKKLEERKQRKKLEEQAKLATSNEKQVPIDDLVNEINNTNTTSNKGKKKKGEVSNNSQVNKIDYELDEKQKLVDMEKGRLQETKKDINEKKEAINSIDSQLEKIQELYSKLHEKKNKTSNNANNNA